MEGGRDGDRLIIILRVECSKNRTTQLQDTIKQKNLKTEEQMNKYEIKIKIQTKTETS